MNSALAKIKPYLSDIRFWIILFFTIRLVGITNPPLETGHNWRQVTGLMVARNFVEVEADVLHPRIDDTNGLTGIIGMEFPLMNYIHYGISKVFGYTHWYGRQINLLVCSIGLYFFYLLASRYFNKNVGFNATISLLGSIWFVFSQKTMPDTFCISLIIIALYYASNYLIKGKKWDLILFVIIGSLAILSKIPAGIYFIIIPLIILFHKEKTRGIVLIVVSVIPVLLAVYWYFVWCPHLSETYGIWYNSGRSLAVGFNELSSDMSNVLERFYFSSFVSYIFFGCFIAGVALAIKNKAKKVVLVFLSVFVIFGLYALKSGFFFAHHNYYIIPFVPVMALVVGYAISLLKNKKIAVFILVVGVTESLANQYNDFFIKDSEKYKLELEAIADKVSNPNDLIVINGENNPQQLYLSHRKGWTCSNDLLLNEKFLRILNKRECKYIFINKLNGELKLNYKVVFENKHYIVYRFK